MIAATATQALFLFIFISTLRLQVSITEFADGVPQGFSNFLVF
jgi:hypothetical protein